ncbi:GPI transamidase component PIG-T [Fasciola hepatica]|uniref:GPI transamidase component PIG-T n=1 Tax=Fasciola hepatica TaxID=6192 RepID=A0A4E0RKT8_FASHE|nr:GPI transamidase component PIG-T [Fasciola hepatica]
MWYFPWALLCLALRHVRASELFDEELLIKDTGTGYTAFHFSFVSRTPEYAHTKQHYDIIPKIMLQLFSKYSVDELHLSMVRGYWDDERWGRNFIMAAPTGAELWAWFAKNTSNVDRAWFELTHLLSGQFCASLGKLATSQYSVHPRWSYRPMGISKLVGSEENTSLMRYAQMPGEGLCSENLTPWMKLLPCKGLKGLTSLLLPTALFRSNYNAVTVDLRRICWDSACSYLGFELKQTLTVVFDRRLLYPSTLAPWSVDGLLGTKILGSCKAASSSNVFVLSSPVQLKSSIPLNAASKPADERLITILPSAQLASDSFVFSPVTRGKVSKESSLPLISVTKYVTGSGTAGGGMKSLIVSRADFPIRLAYLDLMPWYTQVLFSTLELKVLNPTTKRWEIVQPVKTYMQHSLARKRMAILELIIDLPPGHQLTVFYKFKRILQRWDEYPPDANHGYFLPAATISYQIPTDRLADLEARKHPAYRDLTLPNWANTYSHYFNESIHGYAHPRPGDGFVRIHSPVVLVTMPTPDFSMPFNALCIVCSVVAVFFGSVHKVTTTQVVAKLPEEAGSKLSRLANRLISRLSLHSKLTVPSAVVQSEETDVKKKK